MSDELREYYPGYVRIDGPDDVIMDGSFGRDDLVDIAEKMGCTLRAELEEANQLKETARSLHFHKVIELNAEIETARSLHFHKVIELNAEIDNLRQALERIRGGLIAPAPASRVAVIQEIDRALKGGE